jgi:hypothetical protein
MSHLRSVQAVAMFAVAAVLLGACSKGGGGGPVLSHSEFVTKANAVCREAIAKSKSLNPSSPDYVQKAIEAAGTLLAQLRGLTPPASDSPTYDAMLGAFEKAIADVGKGDFKDAAAQQTTYVHAADKLGLSECTSAGLAS